MARQVREVVLCDVCGAEDGNSFIIKDGTDARKAGVRVDLCDTHAKPVQEVMEKGAKVKQERQARRKQGQHSISAYEPS